MAVARAYADFDQHPPQVRNRLDVAGFEAQHYPAKRTTDSAGPREDRLPLRSQFRDRHHQYRAGAARYQDLPALHRRQGFHSRRHHAAQPARQAGRDLRRAGFGQPRSGRRGRRGRPARDVAVGRRRSRGDPGDRRLRPAAPRRVRADAEPHEPHALALPRPQRCCPRSTSKPR